MPLVSISKATKLAGVSRQHVYDAYINTGILSIDRSEPNKPKVDTSEIRRVGGKLNDDNQQKYKVVDNVYSPEVLIELERLRTENEGFKALLRSKEEQVQRELARTEKAEERADKAEQHYRALLEDKLKKPENFLTRFKALFSS